MGNDLNKKKIRIYGDGQYLFTTTRHDTIKDAINAFKKGGDISVTSIPGYKVNFNDYAKVTGEIVEELKEATDDRDGARYYIFDNSIGAFDDDYEEFDSKKDFLDSLAYNHSVAVDFEDQPEDLEEIKARFDSEDEHSEELNGFLYVKLTETPIDKFLGEKLDEAKYPGWRHMTSTERRNARMNAIFTGKKDLDNAMKKYLLDLGVEPDRVDMLYRGDALGKELVRLGKNADFFNRYDMETGTLKEDKKKFECKKIVKESKDRPVYVITMYEKYPLYASEEGGYYYDGVEIIDQSDVFNSIDEAREALKKWADEENFEYFDFNGDYAADTTEHEYIGEGRFMQIESDDDDEFDDVASRESGRKFYESVERKFNFQKGDLKVGDTVKYGDEVSKIFDLEWDDDFGYDVLIRGKDGRKWWVGDNVEKITKDIKEDKSNSDGTVEFDLNTNVYPVLNAGQYYTALELPDEAWFEDDDEKNDHNSKEWDRWILECAKPYIEDGLEQTSDEIVLLDGIKYYHPNAYNFANDEIEFTVRLKEDLLNSLIEEYKNKPEFVEFLKKYRSYDGFWSDMASDLDEFNEQEKWKSLCQILAFNSLGDKKERQNFFEMDVLEGVGSGRADLFLNDWEEESLKEGVSKNMTPAEIAKKHNVPLDDIKNQLAKGIKVEKEHTDDEKKARRIALDHLFEIPDYYDRLGKMEKGALKEGKGSFPISQDDFTDAVKKYTTAKEKHGESSIDYTLGNNLYVTLGTYGLTLSKITGRKEYTKHVVDWKNKTYEQICKELSSQDWKLEESLQEDTIKTKSGKWVNKGKEGTHGEFKTKKAADAQRKAMFSQGYQAKEGLDESKDDGLKEETSQDKNSNARTVNELTKGIEEIKKSKEPSHTLGFGIDLDDDYFLECDVFGKPGDRTLSVEVVDQYGMGLGSEEYSITDTTNSIDLERRIWQDAGRRISRSKKKKVNESMDIDEYVEWLVNIKGWDKDHAVEYAKLFYKEDGTLKEAVEDNETLGEKVKVLAREDADAGYDPMNKDELSDELKVKISDKELDTLHKHYIRAYNTRKSNSNIGRMGKDVRAWWDEVERWNSHQYSPLSIDNRGADDEDLLISMFDILTNELKTKAPELYKKGKRIYNRYAQSKINEAVEDKVEKETIRTPRGTFELYDGTYRDFKAEEDSEDWGLWFDHYYPDDVAWEDTEKWYKIFHNHVNNHAIAVLYKKLK